MISLHLGKTTSHFPKGPKLVFLYLIEGSDNIHGSLIGSAYESLIMYSTYPLLQFENFSEFMYIWEAIPAITQEGLERQFASKDSYFEQKIKKV